MTKRIERMGRWVDADEAFEAWTSADLARMLAARSVRTNPIDRHFLLQSIVKETYRLRSDPKMKRLCIETGMTHLSEFSAIAPALRTDFDGTLPRVPSFAWLATALAEEGRVEEAVRACETAARFGLEDGTKAGYLGRAERLARQKSHDRRDA
jgi:hypothetical protein